MQQLTVTHKTRISVMAVLASLAPLGASAGDITHHEFASEVLGRDYPYTLYLPDGYEESALEYPTLYLLHGSFGNENDWAIKGDIKQSMDRLISTGEIPPAIVVMPGAQSWWVDGYNEAAETAFFNDLIPHVDSTYRSIAEREGRVVGGLSAGGYGTVNFVLEHPDMFAAGAALSPASYVPVPPDHSSGNRHPSYLGADGAFDAEKWASLNYTAYIDGYKAQQLVVPLYINSGDHDTFDIAYHAAVLYQSLREHQPGAVEYRVVDGDHEWKVWSDTLPEALDYVFSYTSRPRGTTSE